jgi:hypothetical protein
MMGLPGEKEMDYGKLAAGYVSNFQVYLGYSSIF